MKKIFQKLSDENKGAALVVLSALLYGFICYFGLHVMRAGFSVYNTMLWRFALASITLLLILIWRGKKIKVSTREILSLLLIGSVVHALGTSIYFSSTNYISTGLATVLLFTFPVGVIIFNRIFYRTKIAPIFYFSLTLIFIGIFFIVDISSPSFDLKGFMLALSSAIFFSLYVVASKKNNSDPLFSTFLICFGGIFVCLIFAYFDNSLAMPSTFDLWINLWALSLICTTLPILLFAKGLRFISSEKGSIISMLEPPAVMLVGYILLDERITFMQFCGSLIVLAGAAVVMIKKNTKAQLLKENIL